MFIIVVMNLSHFFIPHTFHHQKGHLVRYYSFISYALLFLVIIAGIVTIRHQKPSVLGFATHISTNDIITDTNNERIKAGEQALNPNDKLSEAAKEKAYDMFAKDYWAHFGPDGEKPWDFITNAGYVYSAAGENLARDFDDSQAVVTAWMNSPSHKENLLNKNYQDIGVAVVNGTLLGHQTTLVVQMFGKPYQISTQLPQASSSTTARVSQSGQVGGATASSTPAASTSGQLGSLQANGSPTPLGSTDTNRSNRSDVQQLIAGLVNVPTMILSKYIAIMLFSFVILFLVIDTIVIRKRGVMRLATHSLAHVSVLAIITFALLLLKSGNIL